MSRRRRPAPGDYLLGPALTLSLAREGDGTATVAWPSPEAVGRELLARIPDDGRERFGIVTLNVRHQPTGILTVSVGCLTTTLVHPREVFAPALLACAASICLWHNHPSGDPEPSSEDLALTRRLKAAGDVLGVEILDHIILGHGTHRFVSLKERGTL